MSDKSALELIHDIREHLSEGDSVCEHEWLVLEEAVGRQEHALLRIANTRDPLHAGVRGPWNDAAADGLRLVRDDAGQPIIPHYEPQRTSLEVPVVPEKRVLRTFYVEPMLAEKMRVTAFRRKISQNDLVVEALRAAFADAETENEIMDFEVDSGC